MIQTEQKYLEWLSGYDSGTSSKTILSLITGIPVGQHDIPYDMADIGRCVRMLRLFPELREKLHIVSDKDKTWMPFIDCWPQLEKGYDEVIKYFEIPESELKKLQKRKNHFNAAEYYYGIMKQLQCASRYIGGFRFQGSISSMKRNQ